MSKELNAAHDEDKDVEVQEKLSERNMNKDTPLCIMCNK